MEVDKSKFKDEKGRYIVQGLFLENGYNYDLSYYTLDGEHKETDRGTFYSLKKFYLDEGDPTEYLFAYKYLYDWNHWKRICRNKLIKPHVEQWREELVLSLRAEGISSLIDNAVNNNNYQAAKWLADRGWEIKERGRPSKEEVEKRLKQEADETKDLEEDFKLLTLYKGNKND